MKQIRKPDEKIFKLIEVTGVQVNTPLCLSQFAVPLLINDQNILFHTLTRECLILDEEPVPDHDSEYSYDGSDYCKMLVSHRFLVKKGTDEAEMYRGLLKVLRALHRPEGITSYTILPTTYCNARCFYCFELGYHFQQMSEHTVQSTIRMIEENCLGKPVNIKWFGGEPLLGADIIRTITLALTAKGIKFRSSIVTNGSLFTEKLVKEAKEQWNLHLAQITLDGNEEEYNRRKNYFNHTGSPFQSVIHSIKLLQKADIQINIRLNTDFDNLDSMRSLAEYMDSEFPDKKNINVYTHPLFQELAGDRGLSVWENTAEIEQFFRDKGFDLASNHKMKSIKPYYCEADAPNAVVINADGSLYHCEQCHADDCISTIDEYLANPVKKTNYDRPIREKCRKCAFLPKCTDFTECPNNEKPQCKSINAASLIHSLKRVVKS